jgi:hypothetical protein
LHAKIGQLLVERDFWHEPPVDEHGPEAQDGRAEQPGPIDHGAMPPALAQPVGLLLRAGGRERRHAGADDRDRSGVHGLPMVWQPSDLFNTAAPSAHRSRGPR